VKKLMNEYDIDSYIETSAKTGENVEKLFVKASKILYEEYLNLKKNQKKIENKGKHININTLKKETQENTCFC
jgi:hypothetical protein